MRKNNRVEPLKTCAMIAYWKYNTNEIHASVRTPITRTTTVEANDIMVITLPQEGQYSLGRPRDAPPPPSSPNENSERAPGVMGVFGVMVRVCENSP